MIALRPWLRLFRAGDAAFIESVLEERALPLDDALAAVVRALGAAPVQSSIDLAARTGLDKGAVHGALSRLSGLKLIEVAVDDGAAARDARSELWAALSRGAPDVPVVDNVELTNICPMSCVMCPTGTGRMVREKGWMEPGLFKKLVDEVAPHNNHGKPLTLHNLGESTLHPQLAEMVHTAARAGLATELSANPGHLPLALYAALEEAGLSRLVLSVDGVDEDTLTRIRGKGARADAAFANLEAIFEHRRGSRAPGAAGGGTRILVQMIRQRDNADQAEAFMARFGALGLDDVTAYVKEIDANTDGDELYEIGRPRRPYLCRAPWRTVVVLCNGDVVPCCHDENGAVVYGNLATSSLRDAWRSGAAEGLRARLSSSTVASSDPCDGCAHRADRYGLPPLDEIPQEPLHW